MRTLLLAGALAAVLLLHSARANEGEDEAEDKIGGPGDPYCEHGDCYEYLGIETDATSRQVKKAYRMLSLKNHPDKNKTAAAKAKFMLISQAYEVLSHVKRKKDYDYFRVHPQQRTWNQHFSWTLPADSDIRVVLLCCLLAASAFQYAIGQTQAKTQRNNFKKVPQNKQRARGIALERKMAAEKGLKNRKGSKVSEKEVEAVLEELIKDMDIPVMSVWDLAIFSAFKVPIWMGKYALFYGSWYFRRMTGMGYSASEKAYATYSALEMTEDAWTSEDEATRQELLARELWVAENLTQYQEDMKDLAKSTNYKKYKKDLRAAKKGPEYGNYGE